LKKTGSLDEKLKKMKEKIEENRVAGYKINLDWLNLNFKEDLVKKAIENKLLIKNSNNEYEWN
jgi:hypothetical protein